MVVMGSVRGRVGFWVVAPWAGLVRERVEGGVGGRVGLSGRVEWGCLAGSGERGQCAYAGEGFDERVGPGVGAGDSQPQLSGVGDDAGGDVEERQA